MKVEEFIKQQKEDGWYQVSIKGTRRQFKHPSKSGRVTVIGLLSDRVTEWHFEKFISRWIEDREYCIVIEKTESGFAAYSPHIPGCIATGKDIAETEKNMNEAIDFHFDGFRADGLDIPRPLTPREELSEIIDRTAPLIVFFGLSADKQREILPILPKRTLYDFPDGDLDSESSIEVLLNCFEANLNSISLRLMCILDEQGDEEIEILESKVSKVNNLIYEFLEEVFDKGTEEYYYSLESLGEEKWSQVRSLSSEFQKDLEIERAISRETLQACMDYRLHP